MADNTTHSREQIKKWFKNGCKPTESHFAALLDSYIHKEDSLEAGQIDGLEELITRHAGITEPEVEAMISAHNEADDAHGIGSIADLETALGSIAD